MDIQRWGVIIANVIIRSAFTIGLDFSYWKNYSTLEVWKMFPREIWCVGCETFLFAWRHFNVISEWTWIWFYCCLVLTAEVGSRRKGAESWLAVSDHSENWTLARNILQHLRFLFTPYSTWDFQVILMGVGDCQSLHFLFLLLARLYRIEFQMAWLCLP